MKRSYQLYTQSAIHLAPLKVNNQFTQTESDILFMQEKLLSAGWHNIDVDDIGKSRDLIVAFLKVAQIYNNVGYLSLDKSVIGHEADNIFLHLGQLNWNLEEFFLEHYYYDFVWIENTIDMQSLSWFNDFKQEVCRKSLYNPISIVSLNSHN